jgi:murein DD-endopeptidase MepM/ murein hydrolase activator NlpD
MIRASRPLRLLPALALLGAFGLLSTSSHTVRTGETLSEIAADHGTSVSTLVRSNGITDPNLIIAGDDLVIPGGSDGADDAAAGSTGSHVVAAGDTILGIAIRHGISVDHLVGANGLVDGWIYEGQRLSLGPVQSVGPPITCPVPGATFVNDWGFPRSGGRAHSGNDLFAPHGTPVHAPRDGSVVQSVGDLGGNQVTVVASDGVEYDATHLDRFGASGWVSAGDVIGYVGTTGNAVGGPAHVHFEVAPGGGPAVNPFPLLVAACR